MKGQLMIEILVGLGIITTVLVVSLTVVTHATRLARASRNKLEATKYTEKVLEEFRNTRDLDKAAFFANQTCSVPSCIPSGFGINGMYSCTMSCTWTATKVDVIVTMSWDDGGTTVSTSIPTVLTLHEL